MFKKQLCGDCKHLEHDSGCGIWCGVHGNNRNYDCPKFEYNWGILTKKEAINHLNRLYYENEQLKEERDYFERKKCDYQKKISILTTDKIQLKQKNEQLKQQNKGLRETIERQNDWEKKAITEIEQLKQQIQQLKQWNKCLAEKRHNELKGDVE